MNKFFLWFVMLPVGLWKSLGADDAQLKTILSVKLLMDDRSPVQIGTNSRRKSGKMATLFNMFIYGLIGIIYAIPLLMARENLLLSLTVYYSFFLFFLWFSLVVSFSSVLVDTRDNLILLPRPVNDRTLLIARLLHIVIYLFRMVLPMSLAGWACVGYVLGWKAMLLFPFPVVLLVFITLFLVNGIYLLIIRLSGPARFKDVMNIFQIVFSVLLFGSYYVLPRLLDNDLMYQINLEDVSWLRALPSYWLATIWTWFFTVPQILEGTKLLSTLSLIVPFVCLVVTAKWLAPKFIRRLAGTELHRPAPAAKAGLVKRKKPLYATLSRWLNRTKEAEAGFTFTWLLTARNRSFKMKLYPALAYIPVYFVVMLFSKEGSTMDSVMERMSHARFYLPLLYMCTFGLVQAVTQVQYSDQYKAAWIFYSSPVVAPGRIMAGALKAVWIKYYLPFAAAISFFILTITGLASLPDIILAQINIAIIALVILRTGKKTLPFASTEQLRESNNKAIIRLFVILAIVPVLGFAHYLTIKFLLLKFVVYPMAAVLLWLLWDGYKKTTWTAVDEAAE